MSQDHNHIHTHTHTHEQNNCCGRAHDATPPLPKKKHDHHKTLLWTSILAAFSHIFCCVLPGAFALIGLLSGFGIIATLPGWLKNLHIYMHGSEVPVLIFSGVVVVFGWLAHYYSKANDCHEVGDCHHNSCQPRKKKVSVILVLASILFIVNLVVYFGFHAKQAPEISNDQGTLSMDYHNTHDH
ncbi:MAG: hypothetical protein KTR28_02105 [Micavibrio sp.]|nr:hypothetical protein [Micavibrio sp.]